MTEKLEYYTEKKSKIEHFTKEKAKTDFLSTQIIMTIRKSNKNNNNI